jgi:hypothetical protein
MGHNCLFSVKKAVELLAVIADEVLRGQCENLIR